eukprot:scaffold5311_cov124-Skeletonema_dohrnii-CCMP3373.AAC.6
MVAVSSWQWLAAASSIASFKQRATDEIGRKPRSYLISHKITHQLSTTLSSFFRTQRYKRTKHADTVNTIKQKR